MLADPRAVVAAAQPHERQIGMYIHMPFCTKRCPFCSFTTAPMDDGGMARYLAALAREIDLYAATPWARDVELISIFLGGGTPSLLAPDALAAILARVHSAFAVAADAEVSIECNPESLPPAKAAAYRAAGVTRVSLGVQSLDDHVLGLLGREHSAVTARAAFEGARKAGFPSVSVDLMYGVPGLDAEGWQRGVVAVLDWGPDHLSAYGLTLDAGSVWGVTGVAGLPVEDTVIEQYWALAREAARRGFEHYEISNYARPGCRSRHNQIYWRRGEYLACGPGACGFLGDIRYGNVRAVPRYCASLEAGHPAIDTAERLTPHQRLVERLVLGLRTADGVPVEWLSERVGDDAPLSRRVEAWREAALMVEDAGRVRLTEAGFLVSDAIFVDLA